MEKRMIVNFFELDPQWQIEAQSNLGNNAEIETYLEPLPGTSPIDTVLWDLSECMPNKGEQDGFEYNAVIGVSNNTALLLNINDTFEYAYIKIV